MTVADSENAVAPADAGAAFALRLKEAIGNKGLSQVARAVGINPSTLHRNLSGSMPAADTAFRLARELKVRPEWLIEGTGPKQHEAEVVGTHGAVVLLPRYDAFAFSEGRKPRPAETIALPQHWLLSAVRTTTGLWLTEMPSDAMPSLAKEGEILICRDPEPQIQDRRIYLLLLDGRPLVRKAFVRPEGIQLRAEDDFDTILIGAHEAEHLAVVGRVLSSISLHTV